MTSMEREDFCEMLQDLCSVMTSGNRSTASARKPSKKLNGPTTTRHCLTKHGHYLVRNRVGVVKANLDYKKSYTLQFVNKKVGLDVKQKLGVK